MAGRYDLVIVGMGSAGLVASEFAARLDLRVAAVEADRLGGDCLWTGCVPSKTLLAAARAAHAMRTAERHGLPAVEPEIDHSRVWRRIRAVQEQIASTDDSPERYEAIGVELVRGRARLSGPHSVTVDGRTLETRFILLCTGSRPAAPDIPGLAEAGFETSETVFELEAPPASWAVIGGGPIGTELAQGFRRLGMDVSLLQRGPGCCRGTSPSLPTAWPSDCGPKVSTFASKRASNGSKCGTARKSSTRASAGGRPTNCSSQQAGRRPSRGSGSRR